MSTTKLIAVDFGSTHISAMAGEMLEDGSLHVISVESKDAEYVKSGIVEKPSGASFKVSELVRLLKNSAKMQDISLVSVSVGAKSMKSVQVTVNRIVGLSTTISDLLLNDMMDECRRKVSLPNQMVFDIIPASYMLDGEAMDDPVGYRANQIMATYHVVIGNRLIKTELDRCFDRTGIVLECYPLMADAVATAVLEEHEQRVGCALINLGATTTTLAVYRDDILHTLLTLPLGARNVTKDIQELGVNELNAEKLKCVLGCAMEELVESPVYIQVAALDPLHEPVKISTKFLANIIEARLEELLTPFFEIIRTLPFELEAGIVISGGGAKLNGMVEYIARKTEIYTRIGDHSAWLSSDTDKEFVDPKYAQLIGTLILNTEYRKDHPIEVTEKEPEKKPKLPRKKLGARLTDSFFNFFNDDNKMNP